MNADTTVLVGFLGILLLSLAWHEAAHAWVADRLGDPTARSLGRVTLNPIKHLDPFLSVVLPVLMYVSLGVAFGGGKPVPINPANFRHRARDFMFVALAGPGSNILLAVLFTLVYAGCAVAGLLEGPTIANPFGADIAYQPSLLRTSQSLLRGNLPATLIETWLGFSVLLNLLLAVFNLMPIPPLDGSRVIGWLLPRALANSWYRLDRFGLFLVLGFFYLMDGFQYVTLAFMPLIEHLSLAADELIALVPAT